MAAMLARRLGAALVATISIALATLAGSTSAQQDASTARPLETALYLTGTYPPRISTGLCAAGATKVRLTLLWPSVAPRSRAGRLESRRPCGPDLRLDASSTASCGARTPAAWRSTSPCSGRRNGPRGRRCRTDPRSANLPDPAAFGAFARALAARFSGSFQGLPRIRYFQAWNEPNISTVSHAATRARPAGRPGPLPADAERLRGRRPRGPARQRRDRRRAGAVPRHHAVGQRPRTTTGGRCRSCARSSASRASLRPTCKTQGRLRRVGDAPVHLRRPDTPRRARQRRLARRPPGDARGPGRRRAVRAADDVAVRGSG